MSDQYPSAAPPPDEIPPIPQIAEPSTDTPLFTAAPTPIRTTPRWIAPAWFFFGIIVGIVGFAACNAFIMKSAAPATDAQVSSFDPAAMKDAAREGFVEALATLQAQQQQQQQAQQPPTPQAVASNAFTVRPANRQGSPDAKVTVYEFSDFQ